MGGCVRSRSKCGSVVAAVLTAIGLVATAACGGAAPSGPPPITIGALVPLSGLGLSQYAAAFRASARDVNAHGGIRGRRLDIEICDDRNDPNRAQACARRLVSHHVIATAANVSEFSMVEGPILDEAGIAQVGGEAINPEDSTLPTAFPLDGGIFVQMAGGMVGMRRRGLHTLQVVTLDSPSGRTLAQLAGLLAHGAEIDLAAPSFLPAAAFDPTPYVQAAMQSKADVVFPGLPPTMTMPFLMASRQAGAKYLVMLPEGEFTPAQLARMGGRDAITENSIEFAALPPLSADDRFAALRTFASDMDAELAAGDRDAAAAFRSSGSLSAWLSVQIIAREAATLSTPDAAHLLDVLRTSPTVDTLGLTPPWAPGRTGLPMLPRVTNLFGYLVTQRNGVEVLADPAPVNPFQLVRLGG
jgi:ABC-type branched-subunit amino acid transport system substrate-binding protein